jgi:hypothetical protein
VFALGVLVLGGCATVPGVSGGPSDPLSKGPIILFDSVAADSGACTVASSVSTLQSLNGSTVVGKIAVVVSAPQSSEVSFYLDQTSSGTRLARVTSQPLCIVLDTAVLPAGVHTLTAVAAGAGTTSLMKASFTVVSASPEVGLYGPVPTATLFVSPSGSDGNSGTSWSDAFATIQKAASVARPGDAVAVAPGTYSGGIVTSASGNAFQRVVFFSQKPLAAHIDGKGYDTAWRNNGSYVDIIGFDVSGADYLGIFNMGSFVRVIGNDVHNLAVPSCNAPLGGAGIDHANYQGEGNETIANVVHDIVPPGAFCNLIQGIYHSNKGGLIQNNIVYHVSANGIQTWHAATGVTITNNLVFDNYAGIIVAGDTVLGDNYLVANNIVMDNTYGIAENGSNVGTHNVYLNNLLYRNVHNFMMETGVPEATLFAPPQLVNFQLDGGGNYHLTSSSPAIDAGVPQGAPSVDMNGIPRPQAGGIDIGPYEYALVVPPSIGLASSGQSR